MSNPEESVKRRTEEVNMVAIFLCIYGNIKTMPLGGTGWQKNRLMNLIEKFPTLNIKHSKRKFFRYSHLRNTVSHQFSQKLSKSGNG